MIRVLIVEDQRMAREDMENYIQSSGRYCLAASITNAAMAETVCRQSRCELVLMTYRSRIVILWLPAPWLWKMKAQKSLSMIMMAISF